MITTVNSYAGGETLERYSDIGSRQKEKGQNKEKLGRENTLLPGAPQGFNYTLE